MIEEVLSKKILRKIPIATPSIGTEEWLALKEPLESGWLTQGPKVKEFESQFGAIHKARALAVTSCTTGLHLALVALGVGPGDEVIVPAFTWIATANAVLYCGATPVLCDVDTTTFNIKIEDVQKKLTSKTKVVIPVHLFGLCVDCDELRTVLPKNVKILEDAACAAGASFQGIPAGALGDIAAFSFHPRKSITTGEGGMVTTNDPNLFCIVEILRNHGAEVPEEIRHKSAKPYILPDFKRLGFNYRMTDLQAALGIVQLSKLQQFVKERQAWADYYKKKLKSLTWLIPQFIPERVSQHAWQSYVCYIEPAHAPASRNEIMEALQQKGISTRPGTHAVHMLTFYKEKFGFMPEDFPGAKACDANTMALPLHNNMSQDDFDYIIDALREL